MKTATVPSAKSPKRNYYYRCTKLNNRYGECPNRKNHRVDRVEPQIWRFVSGLLLDPEQLRADLDAMIELEREGMRGNPDQEVKAWVNRLVELDRQRARAQDAYLEGVFEVDELRAKLAALEEARETARRELAALEGRREQLAKLEHDRDALVERYAGMAPDALHALTPEERRRVYKMLKLGVSLGADGTLEVSGTFADDPKVCEIETLPR